MTQQKQFSRGLRTLVGAVALNTISIGLCCDEAWVLLLFQSLISAITCFKFQEELNAEARITQMTRTVLPQATLPPSQVMLQIWRSFRAAEGISVVGE